DLCVHERRGVGPRESLQIEYAIEALTFAGLGTQHPALWCSNLERGLGTIDDAGRILLRTGCDHNCENCERCCEAHEQFFHASLSAHPKRLFVTSSSPISLYFSSSTVCTVEASSVPLLLPFGIERLSGSVNDARVWPLFSAPSRAV